MKLIVTGANGMVGAEVIRAALKKGHRVLAVGRGPNRMPYMEGASLCTYREVDLTDTENLKKAAHTFQPEGIIHAGAMTDVDACERSPHLAWSTNFEPTRVLADVAARHKARMLYVSTDSVFDGEDGPYIETDIPNPINVYSRTKFAGEMVVQDYVPNHVIARIGNVYGGRKGGKATFADLVVEKLQMGQEVPAFSDQFCSTTLASAAGERLVYLFDSFWRGVVHASDRGVYSREEFARAVAIQFGLDGSLIKPVKLADQCLPAARPLRCGLIVNDIVKPLNLIEALRRYRLERA